MAMNDSTPISLRRPGEVRWECNLQCNLSCEHCYIEATPDAPPPAIDAENAYDLVDRAAAFGPFVFQIEGGETMMRDDIVDVIDYATTKPWKVVLNTNGTMLTDERWRQLDEAGLHQLNVSVDGPPEVHDSFRGREGLYEEIFSNVRRLSDLDVDLELHVNTVVNERNWDNFHRMADDVEDSPVDQWDLIRYHPMGRGDRSMSLTPDRLESAVETAGRLKREMDVRVTLDPCFPMYNVVNESGGDLTTDSTGIISGNSILTISPEGKILPGPHLRAVAFGDVFDDEIDDVLDRKESFVEEVAVPETCTSCEEYGVTCKGGSREIAKLVRGEYDAMDPGCWKVDQCEFEPRG